MPPCLLVIDVQNAFFKFSPAVAQSLNEAIEYINAVMTIFRDNKLPIVCIQHKDEEEGLVPGEEGFDLPESLQILPTDPHIHKTYGNGFTNTPLTETLRELGVDTLFLTGFCAEYCVLSTCRGSEDHDFKAILMRGALASGNAEHIKFVENINDVISYGALKQMIGQ